MQGIKNIIYVEHSMSEMIFCQGESDKTKLEVILKNKILLVSQRQLFGVLKLFKMHKDKHD